jgi:hypothetical protein
MTLGQYTLIALSIAMIILAIIDKINNRIERWIREFKILD